MQVFELNIRIGGKDGVADSKELALALIDAASRIDHGLEAGGLEDGYYTVKYMGRNVGRGEVKQVLGTVS
jgi:hypothetical protein